MGGSQLQTPVVWLPKKKGQNNKIEKGEDERGKGSEETHCREQNNRLLGKEMRLEGAGEEWKSHAIQEEMEKPLLSYCKTSQEKIYDSIF